MDMKYKIAEWQMNKRWQQRLCGGTYTVTYYLNQTVAGISSFFVFMGKCQNVATLGRVTFPLSLSLVSYRLLHYA